MEEVSNNGSRGKTPDRRLGEAGRRRTPWPLIVVAVLFVVVPTLTWYWTWFGRDLNDAEIGQYLGEDNPRHEQHALSQIAERIEKGDQGASRWNPQVVAISASPVVDLRMTAAWVMGLEHRSDEFHAALIRLLDDPEPIVRRNAALALVRFGDSRCREELLSMLRPYTIKSAGKGTILTVLTAGTPVKRGSLLAKFRNAVGAVEEIRSPIPGIVEKVLTSDDGNIEPEEELFIISPDAGQVSDALVGLYYFGDERDIQDVERYAGGIAGMPEKLKTKAAQTAEAIKRRISKVQ